MGEPSENPSTEEKWIADNISGEQYENPSTIEIVDNISGEPSENPCTKKKWTADNISEEPADSTSTKEEWIADIISGLHKRRPPLPCWSICKVPTNIRSVNEDAYTPHMVSIGPIHHEDKKLFAMEDHKKWYLNSLFNRTHYPKEMLGACYVTLLDLDEQVRNCYAEPIEYHKFALAEILLHDAGFILELFFSYKEFQTSKETDLVFSTSWIISTLRRDLTLLENQIPFFVLKSVFHKLIAPDASGGFPTLKELALLFFKSTSNSSEEALNSKINEEVNHLLHLLYNRYLPSNPMHSPDEETYEVIHCATSLSQAGVVFQKNTTNDMFDIHFHNGTFKIRPLRVHHFTDSLFRNLVAFEQCQHDSIHYITSYIMLMDRLIDTANDVELLQRKGIIVNELSCGDDVSNLFNNLCKEFGFKKFYFAGLCNQVNAYAKTRWHRYIASARRDYFNNPWSIMSFLAAVAFIVLTFLQTLYSLLSYYKS
ncbi:UPF0481 protein At3g47200-like [Tripterygium wilfordii]|uniref:UPF0481 protein At3g47200-like n=1 Tax=Tripterygium wilfordii TaxID=458696 RepID=UPI0018F83CC8|nr:UPF0481 protein At3g47200-like [Tripterygium wilfordii]